MKKICVVCKREFEAYSQERTHSRGAKWVGKRPFRSVTCSKKCSGIHSQNLRREYRKLRQK